VVTVAVEKSILVSQTFEGFHSARGRRGRCMEFWLSDVVTTRSAFELAFAWLGGSNGRDDHHGLLVKCIIGGADGHDTRCR
jgi:hypothetical protein